MPKLKITQSSKAHLLWTWGEDWEGLTTVPFLNAVLQSLECFLFGTAYYLSAEGGFSCQRQLIQPPFPLKSKPPPQKRVLLSRRRYLNSASLPFPFLHILSKQGFFFTTSPDARNIKVVPIGKQHFLSFGDKKILLTNVITFLTKVT